MFTFVQKKHATRTFFTLYRRIHNEYLIVNENNGSREIILNHAKTK